MYIIGYNKPIGEETKETGSESVGFYFGLQERAISARPWDDKSSSEPDESLYIMHVNHTFRSVAKKKKIPSDEENEVTVPTIE